MDGKLVVALCVMAFVVLAGYECARSPAKTILAGADPGTAAAQLTAEQRMAEREPIALLLVVIGVLGVVSVYNRYSSSVSLPSLVGAVIAVSAGTLVLVQAALAAGVPGARFAVYVWKDIYIVLVLEAFWTFANSIFPLKSALRTYGLMLACGSLGSSAGARASRVMGDPVSTLWLVLPSLAIALLAAMWIARRSGVRGPAEARPPGPGLRESLGVLRESRYVLLLVLMVFSTQMVIVTTEFLFNIETTRAYGADPAALNAAYSTVYEYLGYGALALQLLAGAIIGVVGVGATMVAVPLLGAVAIVTAATMGGFAVFAGAHLLTKVLDYSLFKAAKEMLYLPLSHREKTQGKAVADMASYRVAKGGAALMLMAIGAAAAKWVTLVFVGIWIAIAIALVARYRAKSADA